MLFLQPPSKAQQRTKSATFKSQVQRLDELATRALYLRICYVFENICSHPAKHNKERINTYSSLTFSLLPVCFAVCQNLEMLMRLGVDGNVIKYERMVYEIQGLESSRQTELKENRSIYYYYYYSEFVDEVERQLMAMLSFMDTCIHLQTGTHTHTYTRAHTHTATHINSLLSLYL